MLCLLCVYNVRKVRKSNVLWNDGVRGGGGGGVFFFNDTATTEIYTLSLHDALPISRCYLTK